MSTIITTTIIHLDVDAFAVSVERALNPVLAGRIVIVGQDAGGRGTVLCASYEARRFGIRNGMPLTVARRRAPQAVFLPPQPTQYDRFSTRLFEFLHAAAPIAERASLDDVFLDVTGCEGLFGGDFLKWGRRLARRIHGEIGLPVSFGIASSKLVARVATRVAKPGHGLCVAPGNEAAFLAPVALHLLPGIGDATRERLREYGIRRVGEVAALGPERLGLLFGLKAGEELLRRARGECHEPVKPSALHRMITHEHQFEEDTADPALLRAATILLAQRLASELRHHGVRCPAHQAQLMLVYTDGAVASRHLAFDYPSNRDEDLIAPAQAALEAAFQRRVRVRSLRLTAPFIPGATGQADFFAEAAQRKNASLYRAIDDVRARHGFLSLLSAAAYRRTGFPSCLSREISQ